MENKKLNGNYNFLSFIQLQKEMTESFKIGNTTCPSVLHLDELFEFFDKHFEEFHQKENVCVVLTLIHRCIREWISRGDYMKDDIGLLLTNLIAENYMNEANVNITFQIVYQVMNSIKIFGNNDVPISEKLLRELIAIVPLIKSRGSASNCIACIHKYMEMFPERWRNLGSLWSYLKHQFEINLTNGITNEIEIDILIQFIDNFKLLQSNFHDEPILISVIQHLLKSDQRKFRKCGYYLLQKLFYYFMDNANSVARMWMPSDHNKQIERSWIIYITILENLEEEQSHLILPSLEHLDELVKSRNLQSTWMNILYVRILTHNNNLVLRWSIEFFMRNFTCSNLCEEVLKPVLQATNSNSLFNYEGYFLKTDYFSSFLTGDGTILLRLLYVIENWNSVPLYIWLENINKTQSISSLTFEEILKISSCVRKLQNCIIRKKAITQCQELFDSYIEKMTMKEYVTYIETLYNPGDDYDCHDVFYSKKSSLIESEPGDSIYKQRFYEFFTNSFYVNKDLLSFLNDVPIQRHGWLKFAIFNYELDECDKHCIKNLYNLDLNDIRAFDVHQVIHIFKNTLLDSSPPFDKYELIECKRAAISFYIHENDSFQIENDDTLHFILNSGISHDKVISVFAEKLLKDNEQENHLCFIDELLKFKSELVRFYVFNYLKRVCDENSVQKYINKLLWSEEFCLFAIFEEINCLHSAADKWINKLASQGDKRIEEAFLFNHFSLRTLHLRRLCLFLINRQPDEKIVLDLLKYHTDITKKKPRYFENSNEHRAKLRIAICIYTSTINHSIGPDILDEIWNILLNENNQLNIIYIYELILGTNETRENVIMKKLKEISDMKHMYLVTPEMEHLRHLRGNHVQDVQNLTSSQQVSIISVAYKYFERISSTPEVQNTVVHTLLSLTMGPNFQTRLLSQISLYQLLKTKFQKADGRELIIQSIEDAMGTKLKEYLNDVRFILKNEMSSIDIILYITNAPFDENPLELDYFTVGVRTNLREKIEYCRARYLNKFKGTKNDDTTSAEAISDQIQRKINPVDLTESNNLTAYPIKEKSVEMIVVATLIDKLPNLGGIARTCEVLGIKNLVMESKMITEKNDFKNLSMTAEKTLNILEVKAKDLREFLSSKKLEGFTIVGAEQTCKSQNFENFKFPEKCVLLLGHEKDGIPAPLLGVLDNTVEVPQFGQVRSLNVHVTGALFMWEYCKQHLIQK